MFSNNFFTNIKEYSNLLKWDGASHPLDDHENKL